MSSIVALSNRIKELDEESKILKQLVLTWKSNELWHKNWNYIKSTLLRLGAETDDYDEKQIVWTLRSASFFESLFQLRQPTHPMVIKCITVLDIINRVKDKKVKFEDKLTDAAAKLCNANAERIDPHVEQFEFCNNMTAIQRKELVEKCEKDDLISMEGKETADALSKEWDEIKAELCNWFGHLMRLTEANPMGGSQ